MCALSSPSSAPCSSTIFLDRGRGSVDARCVKNRKIEIELEKLEQEKHELTRKLEIVASNIAILHRISGNGKVEDELPSLFKAATEMMKTMRRFTRKELAERVRHVHAHLRFQDDSVAKPISSALAAHQIKQVQANQGNKSQAVYEWVEAD